MLATFVSNVNVAGTRVHPGRPCILLCGGETSSVVYQHPSSLRDAFLRGSGESCVDSTEFVQIEKIEEFFDKGSPYVDLVEFERDIAQVCELVLLFSESSGSFAELGAFSVIDEIFNKLLVIVRMKFLNKSGFIAKGPLANLKRSSNNSIISLVDSYYGINGDDVSNVNCDLIVSRVADAIKVRLKEVSEPTTLDVNKFNHICKLYLGLLDEFYALRNVEMELLLDFFGFKVNPILLDKVTFCCAAVGWSNSCQVGSDRVHYAYPADKVSAQFDFTTEFSDRVRRRARLREMAKAEDPEKVAAVDEVARQ